MFRKDLIDLLRDQPRSVHEIARLPEMRPQDVEDDLAHLLKSLRHTGYRAVIEPARCRHCGFQFGKNKLHKPGKCPKCRQTWIADPLVRIEGSGE